MSNGFTEWTSIDRNIIADAYTSNETRDILYTLCDDIGARFAGTEGDRIAVEFIQRKLREYRLDTVATEPFDLALWRRGEPAELSIVEPFVRHYPCFALPYGALTPEHGLAGPLVDIGPGAKEDIEKLRDRIRGAIVLTIGGGAHRCEIYGRASDAGAIGFVLMSRATGMMLPTGTVGSGKAGPIPAIGIANESGLQILRMTNGKNATLRIVTHDVVEPGRACNVVGELRGTEFPDEIVIVGGHMDSHDIGPGAVDNATGTTEVIEAARLLAGQRQHLKRTVRFVTFGAEEIGLLGSSHHVRSHADEMPKVRLMLNLDSLKMSRPKGLMFHRWAQAEEYVETLRRQMQEPLTFRQGLHQHSDHFPFVLAGVPTAEICGGPHASVVQGYGHMAGDTADKVSLIDLREEATLSARVALRAANDPNWPFLNRSQEEVAELLERTGIREALKFEGGSYRLPVSRPAAQ